MPPPNPPTEDLQLTERVVVEATLPAPGGRGVPGPAALLDAIGATAAGSGAAVARTGPGGAVCSFAPRDASDALNAAIRIQEVSRRLGRPGGAACSIGVALGTAGPGSPTAAGLVGRGAATAGRLAAAAQPGSVLVDIDTVAAANLLDVASEAGRRLGRTHHDYLGPVGHLPGQGSGTATITFVELVWDDAPHGVREEALADQAWWQHPPAQEPDRWRAGTVRSWNDARQHGFIVSDDEFFYFDDRFIVGGDPPPVGSQVWFHARPPLIAGKSRLAVTVLGLDHQVPAGATPVDGPDGPATQVTDRAGNRAVLPVGAELPAGGRRRVVAGFDAQPRLA